MSLSSFSALSYCAYCHSAHSPNKLTELRMHRKKSPLSTWPGEFIGTVSEKNDWGILTCQKYFILGITRKRLTKEKT
jgi:hypothetical protein